MENADLTRNYRIFLTEKLRKRVVGGLRRFNSGIKTSFIRHSGRITAVGARWTNARSFSFDRSPEKTGLERIKTIKDSGTDVFRKISER